MQRHQQVQVQSGVRCSATACAANKAQMSNVIMHCRRPAVHCNYNTCMQRRQRPTTTCAFAHPVEPKGVFPTSPMHRTARSAAPSTTQTQLHTHSPNTNQHVRGVWVLHPEILNPCPPPVLDSSQNHPSLTACCSAVAATTACGLTCRSPSYCLSSSLLGSRRCRLYCHCRLQHRSLCRLQQRSLCRCLRGRCCCCWCCRSDSRDGNVHN